MATTPEETVKVETPVAPISRKEAIAEALKNANLEDNKINEEEKPVKTPEEKVKSIESPIKESSKESKEKEEKEDEDKELAAKGLELMKALNDPSKAPLVIKFLAEQAGYTKAELKKADKEEIKEVKDDILNDLRAGLGEEFSIIADRLAPAIEKILKKEFDKNLAETRQKFEEQESEKLKTQSATAIEKLSSDFFGAGEDLPPAVQKEMSAFMDRVAPSKDSTVKEYVGDAFHYAIGKLGLQKVTSEDKERKTRSERNRTDAASRLASERVPAADSLKPDNSKPLTRQEAIQRAIEAANKEG